MGLASKKYKLNVGLPLSQVCPYIKVSKVIINITSTTLSMKTDEKTLGVVYVVPFLCFVSLFFASY